MPTLCDKIQQLGKGIGSTSRYHILEALMNKPKTVSELVSAVKLSQPAVSQHLATLKACNLVKSRKQGQEVYYSLHAEHMLGILRSLTADVVHCKKLQARAS
jgi:DNA-binding transcriptional ArsR family regulator